MTESTQATPTTSIWNVRRLALVLTGIIVGQAVLYGPALLGNGVLLPLGVLAEDGKYVPHSPDAPRIESPTPVLIDLVAITEPGRIFAAKEIAAGRLPRWTPHEFGGVPVTWPQYSPYFLLTALSETPFLIAWVQLLGALVAGLGAYVFCARVLRLGPWPSTLAAWCYPFTAWFILWQGYAAVVPVIGLPWILHSIDRCARGIRGAGIGLAIVTGLVMVSGNPDIAGQVILVAGLFTLWCVWDVHRRQSLRFVLSKGGLRLALGFGLGFMLASPYILPFRDYANTSIRLSRRGGGVEERPPVGLLALPQIVLPDMYGTYAEPKACPLLEPAVGNQLESPAQCYTGLLATLLLAPWAFRDRRRRSASVFLLVLTGVGLSWTLNVPGMVQLLRLPFLKLMSHNRLVFASSFAILALAAIGLEVLIAEKPWRSKWWILQGALLSGVLGWCIYRSVVFPEPLATIFEKQIKQGNPDFWARTPLAVQEAKRWFSTHYQRSAALCASALALWLLLKLRPSGKRFALPVIGLLMFGDLVLFGIGKRVVHDPLLYYPEVPALKQVATGTPGREICISCLPANFAQAAGLYDIRGFDSVDPERWLKLLWIASGEEGKHSDYAATQYFVPRMWFGPPNDILFAPVLDMLSVRYAIFRGTPPKDLVPRFRSEDYWVMENPRALPRVFVPKRVESITKDDDLLHALARKEFNPSEVAYVSSNLAMWGTIRGRAAIKEEIPTRVVIEANMETRGLLVLADNWDKGWQAFVNGKATPVLRTNYAIRGVVLPPGPSTVEFRYEPRGLVLGNRLALAAIAAMLVWIALLLRRRTPEPASPSVPGVATVTSALPAIPV
jgi:hypothetical protein